MKNMKLFPKTFLHCLGLLVGVVLVAFLLIYSFLPSFYARYKQSEVESAVESLAAELQTASSRDIAPIIEKYSAARGCGCTATYEDGTVVCETRLGVSYEISGDTGYTGGAETSMSVNIAESGATVQTPDGRTISLSLYASLQPIDDAVAVLLLLLPAALAVCVLLSVVAAWLYARSIAKPICAITGATVRMRALDPNAACEVAGEDEIAALSRNVNGMYSRLLDTISELERNLEEVSRTEQEKLDFLLLASHELKTPITAVRGMVEGMLCNVGVYKDRDRYLAECGQRLEELTALLCRILETTKLDPDVVARNAADTDVAALLHRTAQQFDIIAQSRDINIELPENCELHAVVPAELIGKVLSNVFSNAVRYTPAGGVIRAAIEGRSLVVENECEPLSEAELEHIGEPFYHPPRGVQTDGDSTGLGMYFIDRTLRACSLEYSFAPCEDGMRFVLMLNEA